jgi:hypothetical protein
MECDVCDGLTAVLYFTRIRIAQDPCAPVSNFLEAVSGRLAGRVYTAEEYILAMSLGCKDSDTLTDISGICFSKSGS